MPLLRAVGSAFERDHPGIIVTIHGGGSARGLVALRAGEAAIAAVSHPLAPTDLEAGEERIELGRTGVAVVVHPTNPLRTLSRAHLSDLFSGVTPRWEPLGWLADADVQVITRESGSGDRAVVERAILDGRRMAPTALVLPTAAAVAEAVAAQPTAIGYLPLEAVPTTLKVLAIDGIVPTPATIVDGSYPLSRPLLIVAPERPAPAAERFLDWLASPTARILIERHVLAPP